jgi:hypothetical protein
MPWDGRRKLVAIKRVYGMKKLDPSIVPVKSRTTTACGLAEISEGRGEL